ncbi:unnamed protein product, partial [Trichogramma brassicae]
MSTWPLMKGSRRASDSAIGRQKGHRQRTACKGPNNLCVICQERGAEQDDGQSFPRPQVELSSARRSLRTDNDENLRSTSIMRGCPGPALRYHQQAAHRPWAILSTLSFQYPDRFNSEKKIGHTHLKEDSFFPEYIRSMKEMLSDTKTYRRVSRNPLEELQSNVYGFLRHLNDNEFLEYKYKNRALTQTNTTLAKCYGLPKIHKPSTYRKFWSFEGQTQRIQYKNPKNITFMSLRVVESESKFIWTIPVNFYTFMESCIIRKNFIFEHAQFENPCFAHAVLKKSIYRGRAGQVLWIDTLILADIRNRQKRRKTHVRRNSLTCSERSETIRPAAVQKVSQNFLNSLPHVSSNVHRNKHQLYNNTLYRTSHKSRCLWISRTTSIIKDQ